MNKCLFSIHQMFYCLNIKLSWNIRRPENETCLCALHGKYRVITMIYVNITVIKIRGHQVSVDKKLYSDYGNVWNPLTPQIWSGQ